MQYSPYFVPSIFDICTPHTKLPPGRFCGGSQEAKEGNSLKILPPPQPSSSTSHNILKQIIQNCLVNSPRDILDDISTTAYFLELNLIKILRTFRVK